MEILERLAFFAVRAIAPLFLVASSGSNGLGLDYAQKGIIYMVWALLQCLIPMVSGGFTDRYGYRKSLGVAFMINILGYVLMAQSKQISDGLAQRGWGSPSVAQVQAATNLLWDIHHPYVVWYYLGAVGLAGTLGMIAFYLLARSPAARGGVETAA